MAGTKWIGQTGEITTSPGVKTCLACFKVPATARELIKEWDVSFQGSSPTDPPVFCEVVLCSTQGSGEVGNIASLTQYPVDSYTLQITGKQDYTPSGAVMPTITSRIHGELVHPQLGYTYKFDFDDKYELPGGASVYIAIFVTDQIGHVSEARMAGQE